MIKVLKIVKEAVARRDLVPMLTGFHFYEGRVQGFNGSLCIDAPFTDLGEETEMTIDATKLYRAATMCKGDFKHKVTTTGKLSITKGKFRAMLPLMPHEDFPRMRRDAGTSVSGEGLIRAMKLVRSFVSEDASRLWSRSILFEDGYACATNNIVFCKVPTLCKARCAIPVVAVDAILNLDLDPEEIVVEENAITFVFSHDLWMRVNKIDMAWPDVSKLIVESEMDDLPPYFAETIQNLLPFCDDPKFPMIKLGEHGVSTSEGVSEATVSIGDFPECVFRAEPLLMVAEKAHSIAFESFPRPCYFEGSDGLVGVIVGVKR